MRNLSQSSVLSTLTVLVLGWWLAAGCTGQEPRTAEGQRADTTVSGQERPTCGQKSVKLMHLLNWWRVATYMGSGPRLGPYKWIESHNDDPRWATLPLPPPPPPYLNSDPLVVMDPPGCPTQYDNYMDALRDWWIGDGVQGGMYHWMLAHDSAHPVAGLSLLEHPALQGDKLNLQQLLKWWHDPDGGYAWIEEHSAAAGAGMPGDEPPPPPEDPWGP